MGQPYTFYRFLVDSIFALLIWKDCSLLFTSLESKNGFSKLIIRQHMRKVISFGNKIMFWYTCLQLSICGAPLTMLLLLSLFLQRKIASKHLKYCRYLLLKSMLGHTSSASHKGLHCLWKVLVKLRMLSSVLQCYLPQDYFIFCVFIT